jgi:hypothetical protein
MAAVLGIFAGQEPVLDTAVVLDMAAGLDISAGRELALLPAAALDMVALRVLALGMVAARLLAAALVLAVARPLAVGMAYCMAAAAVVRHMVHILALHKRLLLATDNRPFDLLDTRQDMGRSCSVVANSSSYILLMYILTENDFIFF